MTPATVAAIQATEADATASVPALFGAVADPRLLALVAGILALLLCMVGFAVIAAVLRFRNRRKEQEWLGREEKWEKALLDVLAGIAEPAAVWERVEQHEELYFVDYLLRFARRVRGGTRVVLAELAHPYLDHIAARMSGGDAERRARAVETVALLGFERFEKQVVGALADPSPLVSMVAARSIARQQRPEHLALLLEHSDRLSMWDPRQLTAVLSSMGADAMPALRRALTDESLAASVRAVAADALRRLHDPEGMDAAAAVLARSTDREVIAATLRLFADLGRPGEAHHVRPYCDHEDPVIRGAALQALIATGTAEDLDLLRQGMHDESGWVAIQAARALKRLGDSTLLCTLARGDDPRSALAQQVLLESA